MTLHALTVPKWGLAMQEATMVSWLVEEGVSVSRGQEIAEIESSKIANALEAPAAGVLRRRVALPGDSKAVGALLAVLADADEDNDEVESFIAEFESRFVASPKADATGPNPETLVINGHAVHFLKVAATGPVLGSPMLLLHGFGADHRNWMLTQIDLAANRDVYALDLPGHGASSKDVQGGTLRALAAAVATFLSAQILGPVHVVGHSLGAAVAATLAVDHPSQVQSLTAVCGPGFAGALNRAYVEGFLAATRRKDLQPVVELLFAQPTRVTREMLDELIAFKRIDGVAQGLRLLIDNALSDTAIAQMRGQLGAIRAPMLIIVGRQDRVVPTALIEGLPAPIRFIESVGHMPQLEAPLELKGLIAEHVLTVDRPQA